MTREERRRGTAEEERSGEGDGQGGKGEMREGGMRVGERRVGGRREGGRGGGREGQRGVEVAAPSAVY